MLAGFHVDNYTKPQEMPISRSLPLRPGFWMHWGLASRTFPSVLTAPEAAAFFTFFVFDDLKSDVGQSGKNRPTVTLSGGMLFYPNTSPPPIFRNQSPVFQVTLAADRSTLHGLFPNEETNNFAHARILAAQTDASYIELNLSPSARFNLESIRRCPFAGACRELALAARGLDLLANFINALDEERQIGDALHFPLDHTLTQVRAAAARLQSSLEHPPSITELAGSVGLSESTLKRGFRQLFRTTPFGYLRALRMDHARELLVTGKATVMEAASFVGYSNPSNFAAAFRKQFGVNPKAFQISTRR